jgi:undecaprenyl pyrophosphate phosphatase UppP
MTSPAEKKRENGDRRLFNLNRALIVAMVAAILVGLTFDQWDTVLRNAILL